MSQIPNLKPADIVFCRKNGLMSLFIRWLQGPFGFSHCCLVGETIDGQTSIYTTGFGGKGKKTFGILPASEFRKLPIKEYLANKQYEVCSYKGITDKQRQQIINWCDSQLGQKYPFRKTAKLFTMIFMGKGIDKITTQPNQQHCYELVAKAYAQVGINLNPRAKNLDPSGYDVKEIYLSPNLVEL